MYSERKEEKRTAYLNEISSIEVKNLVYIDESGFDPHSKLEYGWTRRGKRLEENKAGSRGSRVNMVAALQNSKMFAPTVFTGSCDSDFFVEYVKQVLVKELRPGLTIIMDNAAFHKKSLIEKEIQSVGCQLKYLPPYSPDLNPIEKQWFHIKNRLKKELRTQNLDTFETVSKVLADTCNKSQTIVA